MLLQVCCLLRTSSIVVPDVSRMDYSFGIELAFISGVVTLLHSIPWLLISPLLYVERHFLPEWDPLGCYAPPVQCGVDAVDPQSDSRTDRPFHAIYAEELSLANGSYQYKVLVLFNTD